MALHAHGTVCTYGDGLATGGRILLAPSWGRNQGSFSSMQLGDQASGRHLTLLYRAFCTGAPVGAARVSRLHPPVPTWVSRRQHYPAPPPRLAAPQPTVMNKSSKMTKRRTRGWKQQYSIFLSSLI